MYLKNLRPMFEWKYGLILTFYHGSNVLAGTLSRTSSARYCDKLYRCCACGPTDFIFGIFDEIWIFPPLLHLMYQNISIVVVLEVPNYIPTNLSKYYRYRFKECFHKGSNHNVAPKREWQVVSLVVTLPTHDTVRYISTGPVTWLASNWSSPNILANPYQRCW